MKSLLSTLLFFFPCTVFAQLINATPREDMQPYLDAHLAYPAKALKKGKQGKVVIGLLINKEGGIDSLAGLTNLGYGMEEEAIRVLKKTAPWKPATFAGMPVAMFFSQPIIFVLPADEKKKASIREVIDDVKTSRYLLLGLKTASEKKELILTKPQFFHQIRGIINDEYTALADSGIYELVLTSEHGDFYMSRTANFDMEDTKVGGLFHPFEQPDTLLFWTCPILSKTKAFKKFSGGRISHMGLSPSQSGYFISLDYAITEDAFTIRHAL
jgi:TonB family protein